MVAFDGDPYLQPNNVFITDEGVVAFGPHGESFRLTEAQNAAVAAIARGEKPSYTETIASMVSDSVTLGSVQLED
jgi:hypothetical protein